MFNKRFTWVNVGVSVLGYVCWFVWYYYRFGVNNFAFDEEYYEDIEDMFTKPKHEKVNFYNLYIPLSFPPLVLSVILTCLFLHLDRLSCCCPCTAVPGEEISVFDPSTDKRFVIKDGEMVEPPEDEGETINSSFCGCCSPAQEQNPGDVVLTVVKKQDVEDDMTVEEVT